jgi:uncharacterized protein (TIGR02246 family)
LVRAVEAAYDEAWCAGDLDTLMECLSADAVLVNPRGEVAVGDEAIRQALGTFLAGEAKGSRHRSTLGRVAFVRDDVAVVDGHATISFGSSDELFEHPFTDILVRSGEGRWVITHVRAYQFEADA